MRLRRNFLVLLFAVSCCLLASTIASAFNESLSFRRTASGSIEAVVSGMTDLCGPVFYAPNEVSVEGATVAINSGDASVSCPLPASPRPYLVTADLGMLTGRSYQVVWSENWSGTTLQISGELIPAALAGGGQPVSAPALSWPGLGLLTLALGVLASRQRRRGLLAE
jgi:hypothetical protein